MKPRAPRWISWAKGPALGVIAGVSVACAIVLTGPEAQARSAYESAYGFDRTWNCALRLVRVDRGLKITEKDEQSGYLLFEYRSPESSKPSAGSLELVRTGGDQGVRVVVQLEKMPRYHEQVLVDDLAKKLRAEYGDPPPRKRDAPAAPPDAGTDAR
jgi:hypothetical protein